LDQVGYAEARFGIFEVASPMRCGICEQETKQIIVLDSHLRENSAERVGLRVVVRHQNSCGVIQEVVEVQKVHGALPKLGREGFELLGNPDLDPSFVVVSCLSHTEPEVGWTALSRHAFRSKLLPSLGIGRRVTQDGRRIVILADVSVWFTTVISIESGSLGGYCTSWHMVAASTESGTR
jgi:hypothetical protein